ncbi:MAG: hypothetical protein ACK4NN_01605 [Rheinheimera sp.]
MSTTNRKMTTAVGVFVLGSLSSIGAVQAMDFSATELAGGYQLAVTEASCGADKTKTDDKAKEAKCGADKAQTAEKAKEGKCGEGKCGGDKAAVKDKAKDTTEKAKEGKCGEGKCGEGKCGGMN